MTCSLPYGNIFLFPEAIKTQVDRRKTDKPNFFCVCVFLRSTKSKHIDFFPLPTRPPVHSPTSPSLANQCGQVTTILLPLRLCPAEHWTFWGMSGSGGTAPASTSAREVTPYLL